MKLIFRLQDEKVAVAHTLLTSEILSAILRVVIFVDKWISGLVGLCIRNGYIEETQAPFLRYALQRQFATALIGIPFVIYGCLLVAPRTAISFVLSFYFLRQRIGGFHASSLLCCLITSLSLETLFCGLLPCMITRGSRYLIVSLSLFYMILTGPNIGKEMHLTEGEFQATTLYSKIRIIAVSLIYIIATSFEKTQDIANGLSLGILMSAFSLALANIISKRRSKHERKS